MMTTRKTGCGCAAKRKPVGKFGGLSGNTYTQIQHNEWDRCQKKRGDRGCEDCGAGSRCPLINRFNEKAHLIVDIYANGKLVHRRNYLTRQKARENARMWCEGTETGIKDRRATISNRNKPGIILEAYTESPNGIPISVK